MERRGFLKGVIAAGVVAGFDTATGRWVREAEAAATATYAPLPQLDGVVVMSDAALLADSTDEGNIVHHRPWAVLRPGSVQDIASMVAYCRQNGLELAPRGEAHSVFGQSLVENGLVVETRWLDTIHSIGTTVADVDAGVLWKTLLAETTAKGVTCPVYTGYIDLTVGGTLSVGGIATTGIEGAQVDRVRELQVVTGAGQVVWCSETVDQDLFHGVLAGIGQLGIITRAKLDLVPAPSKMRQWSLLYANPRTFFNDLRTLLGRGEIPHVYGQIAMPALALAADPTPLLPPLDKLLPLLEALTTPIARGLGSVISVPALPLPTPWLYVLNVAAPYEPGTPPNGGKLLRGMHDLWLLRQQYDRGYTDYVQRVDELINLLKELGLWNDVPRPWIDVFLPGEEVEDFVIDTFADLTFDDVGLAGFGLLFPQRRDKLTRPNFRVPDTQAGWVYLFDVLTSAPLPGPNTAFVAEKLARNRQIYERARAVGGTLYPISAAPMEPADWAQQYGSRYATMQALKDLHDPDRILTPGIAVFP